MRSNGKVTGKNVPVNDNHILISRTDTKGIITYASQDFIDLSGFSNEELLQSPHNIVRHPDVPEWVFQDLWDTVKQGKPWTGVVKNRCKNGDHYWVFAEVSPLREGGKITGYMSNRYQATPEQLEKYEKLYKLTKKPKERRRASGLSLRIKLWGASLAGLSALVLLGAMSFLLYRGQSLEINAQGAEVEIKTILGSSFETVENFISLSSQSKLNPGSYQSMREAVNKNQSTLKNGIDFLKQISPNAEVDRMADEVLADGSLFSAAFNRYLDMEFSPESQSAGKDLLVSVGNLNKKILGFLKLYNEKQEAARDLVLLINLILIGSATALGSIFLIVLPIYIQRSLLEPVLLLEGVSNRMAEGDLSGRLLEDFSLGDDEIGRFVNSMRVMRINLRGLISQMIDTSRASASVSGSLADHATNLSIAAKEQATAAGGNAEAVGQLGSSSAQVLDLIEHQTQDVSRNRENSRIMVGSMEEMSRDMADLKNLARESAERASVGETTINMAVHAMQDIRTQAARIGEIVNLITEISEQTNLLSLNAAIEAARAGEGGRGFAVVADEISRLADRTSESVKEIEKLIKITTESVENGSTQFSRAAGNFTDILHRVSVIDESVAKLMGMVGDQVNRAATIGETTKKVTDYAERVQAAAGSTMHLMDQMNENASRVTDRSEYVGQSALDLANLVSSMKTQADVLKTLVARFRVK